MNPNEVLPADSASAQVNNRGRESMSGTRHTAGFLGGNRLPPVGVLLARPFLLGLCAILGAIGGYLFTGGDTDSAATATIVFASPANGNRDVVALDGATLARTIVPPWVLQRAATSLGEKPSDLEPRTTVTWQDGTRLLNVTTTAPTGDQAIKRANAVADAAVTASDEARSQRLNAALQEANSLLADAPLADPDAEVARRSQIGTSVGQRQNQIQSESMSLIVISPAVKAMPAALSTTKGVVVGLASGLLAGAILAVLMGSRGLRVPASGSMQRLAPDVDVLSAADLPRIAGQLVEVGETLVVVIAARGESSNALAVSHNLQRLLSAHRKAVKITRPDQSEDLSSIALVLDDASQTSPSRHMSRGSRNDTEMVLLNVDDGTEAATMLAGRTGFTTMIVVRQHKTPLSSALATHRSFARTRSFLLVATKSTAKT